MRSRFASPKARGTRWQTYFLDADIESTGDAVAIAESSVRINAVLSLASAPEPNRLEFAFDAPQPMDVTVEVHLGSYDPLSSAPVDTGWVELAMVEATPGDSISIDIPVDELEQVAYPTNFIKEIAGERTNVYHSIHIQRLRQLAELAGRDKFVAWADRWEDYICTWSQMSVYDGMWARSPSSTDGRQHPADFC